MKQTIARVTLLVRDYDEAIDFYTHKLHFAVTEDTPLPQENKRWVEIVPQGGGVHLLLARASDPIQQKAVGNQSGGRVFLFLSTDNFRRDYREMCERGIHFVRPPARMEYGWVAVFEDLYGNLWDLIEFSDVQKRLAVD